MKKYFAIAVLSFLCARTLQAQQAIDTIINRDLFEPFGIAVDTNNVYYITDGANNRILKYIPDTSFQTNFSGGIGPIGRGYVDGAAHLARFSNPQGIVYVPQRNGFVVADSGNHRIRFVALDGTVSPIAGSGVAGSTNGVGVAAQFNSPAGLAVDGNGNVYVADFLNGSVRKVALDNTVTTVAGGFHRPAGVAVGDGDILYVADSGNHSIKEIRPGQAPTVIAGSGSRFSSGNQDALIGLDARFNNPRGVMWVGGSTGLLVADSGNGLLRIVHTNPPAIGGHFVQTLAASATAGLGSPTGLGRDKNLDILIVDSAKHQVGRIVAVQNQTAVADPVIGTIELVEDTFSGNVTPRLFRVISSTFNNDVIVGIRSEQGAETFYTEDSSDPSANNGKTPPNFDGVNIPNSMLDQSLSGAKSDILIKAISTAAGRRASAIVSARFQFQVANPTIIGNNPGNVTLDCLTTNAVLRYTTDGSDPTTNSLAYARGSTLNIVRGDENVTLKVRGFRNGYAASRVTTQTFSVENFVSTTLAVERDLEAGVASTIVVPVDIRLRPEDLIRSLQYRIEVTPIGNAPIIEQPLGIIPSGYTIDRQNVDFITIPVYTTNTPSTFTYTNGNSVGLLVAYLGIDTVTDSHLKIDSSGILNLVKLSIPPSATVGAKYSISILNPSATRDAFRTPVVIKQGTAKTIVVTNNAYVVGDSAPSKWYNAGTNEFGNGNLNNNDVNNAFFASIGVRTPFPFTDAFDAMDTYPEDSATTPGGSGTITFEDWQVILRRALRLDTNNWLRSWGGAGGNRQVIGTNLNSAPNLPAEIITVAPEAPPWTPDGSLAAAILENINPGDQVSVPVTIKLKDGVVVSGLQFRASILTESGQPILGSPLTFIPAAGIRAPSFNISVASSFGAGWPIGSFAPALVGTVLLGNLVFTVPARAAKGEGLFIRFSHVGGSKLDQTGKFARYTFQSVPGAVWVQSTALKAPEVITDEWRTRFFGNLRNALTDPNADPDGDGKSNLQEFLEGNNPAKLRFHNMFSEWRSANGFRLRWFAASGKAYVVESSPDLKEWTVVGTIEGAGDIKEIVDARKAAPNLFYRIREK